MATYLITGTSQGLGLALTAQLLSRTTAEVSHVFALSRSSPSQELRELLDTHPSRSTSVVASVTDDLAVGAAVEQVSTVLGSRGLDVLINNAGTNDTHPKGMRSVEVEALMSVFELNVMGVKRITIAFLPLLERGNEKKIINMCIIAPRIELAGEPHEPTYAYKVSKAAMNMLTMQYALDLQDSGFTVMAVSPGWLKARFGGGGVAQLTAEQGAEAVEEIIREATKEDNGKFVNIRVPGYKFGGTIEAYPRGEMPW
ncbi:hypothetical protein B0A48_06733 [Cryoendolithus antarcticus]|uniref:Uncharacterized protein n=1 Tax=Cryoendolithus antarcticus TaxID=1507870 RepID=A0A1V8T9K8_9PEZI|nr:hypothetical protein B0A48_06733 [Cryoendolithus antarcticus]